MVDGNSLGGALELLYLALIFVELSSWLRIAGIIYFIMLLSL